MIEQYLLIIVVVVVSCFSGCEFNFDFIEKFRLWYWQLRGLMSSTSLIGYIQFKKKGSWLRSARCGQFQSKKVIISSFLAYNTDKKDLDLGSAVGFSRKFWSNVPRVCGTIMIRLVSYYSPECTRFARRLFGLSRKFRLVSYYSPECTWLARRLFGLSRKFFAFGKENKNLEIYNKTADIISGVTI